MKFTLVLHATASTSFCACLCECGFWNVTKPDCGTRHQCGNHRFRFSWKIQKILIHLPTDRWRYSTLANLHAILEWKFAFSCANWLQLSVTFSGNTNPKWSCTSLADFDKLATSCSGHIPCACLTKIRAGLSYGHKCVDERSLFGAVLWHSKHTLVF